MVDPPASARSHTTGLFCRAVLLGTALMAFVDLRADSVLFSAILSSAVLGYSTRGLREALRSQQSDRERRNELRAAGSDVRLELFFLIGSGAVLITGLVISWRT